MSKRFTDTQIWEKEWFMSLSTKHKCLWRYITERCDQSGVWEPNFQLATIYIGEPISKDDLKILNGHVELLTNGKYFIPDFINFQYGRLSESSPAHKPIFKAIEKNNLTNRVFNRVSNTLQEKEEEMELDKEKEIFGSKGKFQISIKKIFTGDKIKVIYDLREYFKDQLQQFSISGWNRFDDFMQENPGRVFDDPNHLYNSFKQFHLQAVKKKGGFQQ